MSPIKTIYLTLVNIFSFKRLYTWQIGPFGTAILLFQVFHIIEEFNRDKSGIYMDVSGYLINHVSHSLIELLTRLTQFGIALLSLVTVFLLIRLLLLLSHKLRWLRLALLITFCAVYFGFQSYLYAVKSNFDFAIFALNIHTMVEVDFLLAAIPYIRVMPYLFMIGMIVWLIISEIRHKTHSTQHMTWSIKQLLYTFLVWAILVNLPFKPYDVIASFVRSMTTYYQHIIEQDIAFEKQGLAAFPLVQNGTSIDPTQPKKRPHVFVIMVESFNANFVERNNAQNKPYTPYFNALIKEGLYIENFFGNSVQSCKGQFATLTSLIPPMTGFGFRHYANTTYFPFTKAFQDAGYHATFFQASGNLLTDNTKGFLKTIGIDDVMTARSYEPSEDKDYTFGWGMQDSRFYRHFFTYFDQFVADNPDTPMIAILPTIFTHNNTKPIPPHMRTFYKNPDHMYHHFANVINLTDHDLKLFIDGLKQRGIYENSVVIITGDHSRSSAIPSLPQNNLAKTAAVSVNQFGCHNDLFQIPFLMLYPNHIAPKRIQDIAFSQIDIGPTLIDLLNIPITQHHFQGSSMLESKSNNIVHIVQPYDGIFLSTIDYPVKYSRHLGSKRETVIDISTDKAESHNIIDKTPASLLEKLRHEADFITLTTQLIKKDRIFPKTLTHITKD